MGDVIDLEAYRRRRHSRESDTATKDEAKKGRVRKGVDGGSSKPSDESDEQSGD